MTKRLPKWITQYDDFPNYKDSHAWRLEKALQIAWKTLHLCAAAMGTHYSPAEIAINKIEKLGKP